MGDFHGTNPHQWVTKEYWRLRPSRASYATRDGWSNEDVDVVPAAKRTWRATDFLWLWLSDGANVGTMQQAGSIVSLGLSWGEAAIAIAVGNLIVAAAFTLNGAIGSRHQVPFAIATRASMGFYFSYFAVVSRLALGLLYFGINTYIGASCMLIMLRATWPSLADYPNALPGSAGVASNKLIAYFVFWILQFPLLLIHPRRLRWLFLFKSVCAVTAAFAMLGWAVSTGGSGPVFEQTTKLSGSAKSWAYVAGVNVAISGKTTLAINISDLSRYAKRPSAAYWQMLFIPLVYWLFSFIGIIIASAGQAIYGTLYWDPTDIIALWTSRAAAFFCAFAFGLATLGTNISTNSIATSNDFAFIAPRWLNLRRGAVLTALVGGWATCPWKIQASAKSLTTFLSGYVIILAPMMAIMITDYWIVRSGSLDRSLVTLLVVVPINLPGLIHAINSDVAVNVGYANFYKASWLTSTFLAALVYISINWACPPRRSSEQSAPSVDNHTAGSQTVYIDDKG
ncbi:permease for cytosine/purines, uracil, thiamine, allantoin-domain-containing protein [Xylariaceae sp. FL0016]|nr:permease for cytosine/purines, uracil, thiamine, allantoin-domain-containing protein [Xylariaceae sp. FL0016]